MNTKSDILNSIIKDLGSFAVAFSGGVDSSFLLYRANKLKSPDLIGLTIRTPYIPVREIEDAVNFTKTYGIKHKIIDIDFPAIIRNNPSDRCYLCKKTLFTQLKKYAKENHYDNVLDGTNADDTGEFRPGMRAIKEMGIRSPLLESGLSKKEIRLLCKEEGLNIWEKPAMACLLTRIPYETEVSDKVLKMIEESENLLFEKGFPGTRVRVHGDVARIECLPGFIEKLIQTPEKEYIILKMKQLGFRYISLDLEGYRTGSLNP